MAAKMYFGVSGKARRVKKLYFGVSGKARRVRKGYIGVGGKARLCYTAGEVAYYGSSPDVVANAYNYPLKIASTSNGTYALFAGGSNGDSATNVVTAYNNSLVISSVGMPTVQYLMGAGHIGKYAIFAGGAAPGNTSEYYRRKVYTYDQNLTFKELSELSYSFNNPRSVSTGNHVIINYRSKAYAFNKNLTRTEITDFPSSLPYSDGSTVSGKALYPNSTDLTVYTSNLTKSVIPAEGINRTKMGYGFTNRYALFAGGIIPDTPAILQFSGLVDYYNSSLTHGSSTLMYIGADASFSPLGEYALFGYYHNYSTESGTESPQHSIVRISDELTRRDYAVPGGKIAAAGANTENFAFFVGGKKTWLGTNYSRVTEVFTVQ